MSFPLAYLCITYLALFLTDIPVTLFARARLSISVCVYVCVCVCVCVCRADIDPLLFDFRRSFIWFVHVSVLLVYVFFFDVCASLFDGIPVFSMCIRLCDTCLVYLTVYLSFRCAFVSLDLVGPAMFLVHQGSLWVYMHINIALCVYM